MSYTPTEWATGDVITSEKLNKIENGIASAGGGGIMYVTITSEEVEGETVYSADKTLDEILSSVESGQDVKAVFANGDGYCNLTNCSTSADADKWAQFDQVSAYPMDTTVSIDARSISMHNEGADDSVEVSIMHVDIPSNNS